jgi:hypothetical protein
MTNLIAWFVLVGLLAGPLTPAPALAVPVTPGDDAEVVEVLPATATSRDERQWRRELAAHPKDAAAATAAARRWLGNARELGDPRFAGQALAALEPWSDPATAPDDVLLMQATVDQYLHEFDAAATKLERLTKRAHRNAQAWLTLATVRRVQGRYAESDTACRALAGVVAGPYEAACLAENEGLAGRVGSAWATLSRLVATPGLPAATRNWLLTTLAELEARAGHTVSAEADYRSALALHRDPYTTISYADFLLERGRDLDVIALLRGEPRSDAVLLRLAIAGTRVESAEGARDASEMRDRIALANERPDVRVLHAREQAMFALRVDADARRALELARVNVRQQREPVDLLLLAQAARAVRDPAAVREAEQLRREVGLVDHRLEALL